MGWTAVPWLAKSSCCESLSCCESSSSDRSSWPESNSPYRHTKIYGEAYGETFKTANRINTSCDGTCKKISQSQQGQQASVKSCSRAIKCLIECSTEHSTECSRYPVKSCFWIWSHAIYSSPNTRHTNQVRQGCCRPIIAKYNNYHSKPQCPKHCSVRINNDNGLCQSSVWADLFWPSWGWTLS